MSDDDLTLEELSDRTGVEGRTLRSWVKEGLLLPPVKGGRGARYPGGNADRARAVLALKDQHGLSLAEIGRRFLMATEEQIRGWAAGAGPVLRGSARDYLGSIGALRPEVPMLRLEEEAEEADPDDGHEALYSIAPEAVPPAALPFFKAPRGLSHPNRTADLAGIERLILQLQDLLAAPAPRRSKGAIWTRIAITPDLELSVRGDLAPRERMLFEQLADQFRAHLTGRTKHD